MHTSPSPPKAASPFSGNVPTEEEEEDDSEGGGLELKGYGSNLRKRMLGERVEGRQILFQDNANDMVIGSPGPVATKVANRQPTPQIYRRKDRKENDAMQVATPGPKSRDAPMEGEEGEMVKSDGEEISFDDALSPPSSATKTEKTVEQKAEEEEEESSK